jgi:hypothetical protein
MKDPAFLAETKKMGLEVTAVTGEDLAQIVAELSETPENIVHEIQAITQGDGKE